MNFKRLERLTAYLESLTDNNVLPCVDCAVNIGGERIYRHTAGYNRIEDKTPVRQDALYNIYSMSKVITCAAALQLWEDGIFLLDDAAAKFIPEFADCTVRVRNADGITSTEPLARPITFRDLFTMSAGLTYNPDVPAIRELRESTDNNFGTVDFFRAYLREPLSFQPGSRWLYSLCHDALGALIEVITGMRFGEYLRKHIFDPCGMKDTGFTLPADKEERYAGQYRRVIQTDGKSVMEYIGPVCGYKYSDRCESGGAGIISTLDDYSRFAEALCHGGMAANGNRILSSAAVRAMALNQLDGERLAFFSGENPGRSGYGYGLGVRTMIDPAKAPVLSSLGEFGWGGAAGSYVLIDPANEMTIVFFTHMLNGYNAVIHPRIKSLVYSSLD